MPAKADISADELVGKAPAKAVKTTEAEFKAEAEPTAKKTTSRTTKRVVVSTRSKPLLYELSIG